MQSGWNSLDVSEEWPLNGGRGNLRESVQFLITSDLEAKQGGNWYKSTFRNPGKQQPESKLNIEGKKSVQNSKEKLIDMQGESDGKQPCIIGLSLKPIVKKLRQRIFLFSIILFVLVCVCIYLYIKL